MIERGRYMPITLSSPLVVHAQEEFHAVDKVVTGCAFDIHNAMGRFLDERIYQAELAAHLTDRGLPVEREMKIALTLDSFVRDYFVDLLINGGVIIETKAAETLTPAHRAQVLSYLYLAGLYHATLLNFRTERVQHEFVSTTITPALRRRITWNLAGWQPLCPGCEILHDTMRRALADWGGGLAPVLYRDAISHFLGGDEKVVGDVAVVSPHGNIGTQKIHQLAHDIAYSVTASVHHPEAIEEHQRRFLQHTQLRAIQWVNVSRQTVRLQTIQQ